MDTLEQLIQKSKGVQNPMPFDIIQSQDEFPGGEDEHIANETVVDLIDIGDDQLFPGSEIDFKDICTYCGNTGRGLNGEKSCPKCGRTFISATLAVDEYPTNIFVPERYKQEKWDKEKAKGNTRVAILPTHMSKNYGLWLSLLELLLKKAEENMIFRDSYIVSAPDGMGKSIWLYSFIRKLHINNVKMSPILFLNEIDVYNSDSYMSYSLLILKVTKFRFKEDINKLEFILQKRKLRDLPTLIVTNIPYSKFTSDVDDSLIYIDQVISLS